MRADAEWLETDGRGGFASGPVAGPRTRRYHALLIVPRRPPSDRLVLVNGFEAWVETADGRWPISTQRYTPGVTVPDATPCAATFAHEPWPTWTFALPDGTTITQEILVPTGAAAVAVRWHASRDARLVVRPFLTGRPMHALHHENPDCRFDAAVTGDQVRWQPYESVVGVRSLANATYVHEPQWYRHAQYDVDRARGYDFVEDLASPGVLTWQVSDTPAAWVLAADTEDGRLLLDSATPVTALVDRIREHERRRRTALGTSRDSSETGGFAQLRRAGDHFLVRRGTGSTIVAGYPWFGDWGRDTCIAVRGLCLATGRLDEAEQILTEWAAHISRGMIPNRFPEDGEPPEYNSVDASLWYVIAVDAFFRLAGRTTRADRVLADAVWWILDGYARGTRYHIHIEGDGLLAAGEPGVQLTWMDARVGDRLVTPRAGKPVEVQALWINALGIGAEIDAPRHAEWTALFEQARASFRDRFWRRDVGWCYDVVDVDHQSGVNDPAFRPNQIFAVGGLPHQLLGAVDGRRLVDAVERRLWTPMGLRTLAPDEPGYRGRYGGDQATRDAAYHQGTVWPWLAGPFIEAWVWVRGGGDDVRRAARDRFVAPLLAALDQGSGLGSLPEVADGDAPHTPGGSPFQAWSVAELLRIVLTVV